MSKTLKLSLAAAIVALSGLAGQASAQAKQLSIAVLDNQKVMTSVNAVKRANDDMTAKTKAAKAKIDALEKPLLEKKQKLVAQQGVMAADKFKEASAGFMKELEGLRQQTSKIEMELNQQMQASRKKIIDGINTAVEQVAKEKATISLCPRGIPSSPARTCRISVRKPLPAPTLSSISSRVRYKKRRLSLLFCVAFC